ncbi:MAG: SDR family NAD(P)-dependent oxidoreductase [Alphaproteobacteria bacterium]
MSKKPINFRNQWALVTGASSGIGEVFARQLAAEGMHLILVARRQERLEALAKKLSDAYGVHTLVLPTDLSAPDAPRQLYHRVVAQGHKVTLLVNNAGIGSYGLFHELPADSVAASLQLNIHALTLLTHYFLPGMLAGGGGAVINIASTAAFQPVPYMASYAATKAYVLSFTEALWSEYRGKNIRFLAVCPGVTATEFFVGTSSTSSFAGAPSPSSKALAIDTPERVVTEAMRALTRDKMTVITGHWSNWLLTQTNRLSPRKMTSLISEKIMRATFEKKKGT